MKTKNSYANQQNGQNVSFGLGKIWLSLMLITSRWLPSGAINTLTTNGLTTVELSNPDSETLLTNMLAISSTPLSQICQGYLEFDGHQVAVGCSLNARKHYQNNPKAYDQDKRDLQITMENISRKDKSIHCEIKTLVSDQEDKFQFTLASESEFENTVAFFRHQKNSVYYSPGMTASTQEEKILRHEIHHGFHAYQNRKRKIFPIAGSKFLSFPFGPLKKDLLEFRTAINTATRRLNQIIQVYDYKIIVNHLKTTYGGDLQLALSTKHNADFMNFLSKNVLIKTVEHQKTILEYVLRSHSLDSGVIKKFEKLQKLTFNYEPFIFKEVYLTDFNSWIAGGYVDKNYQILKPIEFVNKGITHYLVEMQQLSPKKFHLFTTTVKASEPSQSLRTALLDQYYMQNSVVLLSSEENYRLGEADAYFYQVFNSNILKIIAPELLKYNNARLVEEYQKCLMSKF